MYSVAVRVASAVLFLQLAFRRAWLDVRVLDRRRRGSAHGRTHSCSPTSSSIASWAAARPHACSAPWLVRVAHERRELLPRRGCRAASCVQRRRATPAFSVIVGRLGHAPSERREIGSWPGIAAALNVGLCLALIPSYGMVGAAVATLVSYVALFRRHGRLRPAASSRSRTSGRASSPLPPSRQASRCWGRARASRWPWPSRWPRSSRSPGPLRFYRPE